MDETDRTLIAYLQRDARIPSRTLAAKAGISGSECVRRVRRLEALGVICRYATVIDPAALGLSLTALVRVQLDRGAPDRVRAFEAAIQRRREVLQCWQLSEYWDFELLVVAADLTSLGVFQRECLGSLGVVAVNVSVVVRQARHLAELQIGARHEDTPVMLDSSTPGFHGQVVWEASPRVAARRS